MKKVLFTLALVGSMSVAALAQVSGGLKAGVNFANQKFEADGFSVSPDGLIGFHVGGYINIAPSEKFSIQPELLYNSVGSSVDETDLKLSYISVPVMFKYNPAPIFNIHAGPQVGFLMSAKADDEDIKDSFKGLDLGVAIGAGVDLPMGLNFNVRYIAGLSNIGEDSDDLSDATVKNNVFQVSVGYRIFGGE